MPSFNDPNIQSFNRLFGNGITYEVPKFQRDYNWDNEQWDDLWQDIILLENEEERDHYMGYLVLQEVERQKFIIVDGQQRLTTLCLVVLAAARVLKKFEATGIEQSSTRRTDLLRRFIGTIDLKTLIPKNKLELNRNNNNYYKRNIVTLEPLPNYGLNSSERLLRNAILWFEKKIQEHYSTGVDIASFIEIISTRLLFSVIQVSDTASAYRVFETLNARGVQLSASDLLKNYFFQVVDGQNGDPEQINEIDAWWTEIVNKLGEENTAEFIRIYWNSYNPLVRKQQLFKVLRQSIASIESVFSFLRGLLNAADTYKAIQDPSTGFWKERPQVARLLGELRTLSVKQPYAAMLAGYENLEASRFETLIRAIVTLTVRYNTISNLNPNDQETAYNELARSISHSKRIDYSIMKKIYVSDEEFEANFNYKELGPRSERIAKYLLLKLEEQNTNSSTESIYDDLTLEHIAPQNLNEDWQERKLMEYCYRLGNLALLEKNLNKEAANKSYEIKKGILSKSRYKLTRSIPERFNQWDSERIQARQADMAKQAILLWRIEFPG